SGAGPGKDALPVGGVDIMGSLLSGARRKNSLQRNDEGQGLVRLHVVVRQVSAGNGGRCWIHGDVIGGTGSVKTAKALLAGSPGVVGGTRLAAAGCALHTMGMRGHFRVEERYSLFAADFTQVAQAQARPLSLLQRSAAL